MVWSSVSVLLMSVKVDEEMVVAGTSEGLEDVPGETELEEEEALKRCGCTHHSTVVWSGFWVHEACLVQPCLPSRLPRCCSLPELHHLVDSILENTVLNIMNEATCGELDFRRPLKTLAVPAQSTKLPTL